MGPVAVVSSLKVLNKIMGHVAVVSSSSAGLICQYAIQGMQHNSNRRVRVCLITINVR